MVLYARDYTLEKFKGSKLVYGDSVLGDEPILLKNIETNQIIIKTIETLGNEWKENTFDYIMKNYTRKNVNLFVIGDSSDE